MGGIINFIRGIYVLVPRNMTKAAGFYNTLLEGDQPALVIECLNKYRSKENLPDNLGDFKTPIGKIDLILKGSDITIVSYGSTIELVEKAAQELNRFNIEVEIIDCQSLIPFDLNHDSVNSLAPPRLRAILGVSNHNDFGDIRIPAGGAPAPGCAFVNPALPM